MSTISGTQVLLTAPLAASRPGSSLADQLPRVMQQDPIVRSYVEMCDEVWTSVVDRLDDLEWWFDVGTAPPPFVRWLATWLGLRLDPDLPVERQRAILVAAGSTLTLRGTRQRLERLLTAATGGPVEVRDSGGVIVTGQVARGSDRVSIRLRTAGGLRESQLRDLVRSELPANATVDFEIAEQPVEMGVAGDEGSGTVVADPSPFGDEGFLPPMRGGTERPVDEGLRSLPLPPKPTPQSGSRPDAPDGL